MNSAHEIRNALMGLGGAIMNLRMSEATDREEMFEAAMEGVNRVQRLADEMQDLSNLDDVLLRTPTDIVDSREVLKEHGRRAVTSADRGLTVALGPGFAGEAVPEDCLVYAVEDKLVQVVANLVLNAVSFTAPGGEITLDCRRDGDWVELSVADQGPGLPEGEEETVFEWLHKRREEGTEGGHSGIGLTVSRQIVRAFGGEIAARNIGDDPGSPRGACFTVRLPAVPERRPFLSAAAVKRALSPRPHHDGSRAGPS